VSASAMELRPAIAAGVRLTDISTHGAGTAGIQGTSRRI
jgi:hypothetical protein